MAEQTYATLKVMTVANLREIAKGIQNAELEGYTTMHKDHLLPILCKVLGIPTHHIAHGAEKTRIKGVIRKVKAKRDEAMAKKDLKRPQDKALAGAGSAGEAVQACSELDPHISDDCEIGDMEFAEHEGVD